MPGHSLTCADLRVGRDGLAFCEPLNLLLSGGELLCIRGENGIGKSTLLRTFAGLLAPVSGHFVHEIADGERPLYIGHRSGMLPEMSVRDNVAFYATAEGAPELLDAALHYFDLEPYADADFGTLSAGWQQRASLTRLITMPRRLWLLDEPGNNLDAAGMALLQSLIQSRLEQRGIVLLTSHYSIEGPNVRELTLLPAQDSLQADNAWG